MTESVSDNVIMCLDEGRGRDRNEVGIATFDLTNPVMLLWQFIDLQNFPYIEMICRTMSPTQILLPSWVMDDPKNRLRKMMLKANAGARTQILQLDQQYFDTNVGLTLIRDLCCKDLSTIEIQVKDRDYCLSAAAALIQYVQQANKIQLLSGTIRMIYVNPARQMLIDPVTTEFLELISNLTDHRSLTLLGLLNQTHTRPGFRLLKSTILQPPTNFRTINLRLQVIEELMENTELFESLWSLMKRFSEADLESAIFFLVHEPKIKTKCAETKIEKIIYLKHFISLVQQFKELLNSGNSLFLKKIAVLLEDPKFDTVKKYIDQVIEPDCKFIKGTINMKKQKCYAVKEHVNAFLDIARWLYSQQVECANALIRELSDKYQQRMKMVYKKSQGFYIQMSFDDFNKFDVVPDEFLQLKRNKNTVAFTTNLMIRCNCRLTMAIDETYMQSENVITELIQMIRPHVFCFYSLANVIAHIDMLLSFTFYAFNSNCARPKFNSHSLGIVQGRHPILDKLPKTVNVPNSIMISREKNFALITGPNMSGKSIFLKTVAILQVMAQMGCFIPAEDGQFKVVDRLFSRINPNDDAESNCSTFMVEIKDTAHIVNFVTDRSLVIIDELGRGTTLEEGFSLCFAVAEALLNTRAFTLFTSHYNLLAKLEISFPSVTNYHLAIKHIDNDEGQKFASFTYKLKRGPTSEKFYGLKLAELSPLDEEIIEESKKIAEKLSISESIKNAKSRLFKKLVRKRSRFNLAAYLFQMFKSFKNEEKENDYFNLLKEVYLKELVYFRNTF